VLQALGIICVSATSPCLSNLLAASCP